MIIKEVIDVDSKTASSIRLLLELAYDGDFSSEDWEHTLGGQYFLGLRDDIIIAHGSVVSRKMFIDGRALTAGYVEAVAVLPAYWRQGFGTQLMTQITQFCYDNYELSMLSTDEKHFYKKLGWRQFQGESFVRNGESEFRTIEEDDGLMFLPGKNCGTNEIRRAICEPRSGDDW
jgi:aminoglycoside 2'-N-acetyltransferase I